MLDLIFQLRKLVNKQKELLLSDSQTLHFLASSIGKVVTTAVANLESTYDSGWAKLSLKEKFLIDLISNFIDTGLYKEDLCAFIHLVGNKLSFNKASHLKQVHETQHKLRVHRVIKCIVRKLLPFLVYSKFSFEIFVHKSEFLNIISRKPEKPPKFPDKIFENKISVEHDF